MAFYMKYGGQGPLAKKSNGALRNKSGLLMSPFNVGPCVNPGEPNPDKLPICGVAQTTTTSKRGTQNGVKGTITNVASITHSAIDTPKPEIPSTPKTTPGTETPPKSKPPSKNKCGKDVSWSDSRCKAYAKKRGGTIVDGKYIPGKTTPSTTKDSKPKPATTTRTYDDVSDNKTTFVPDPPKEKPKKEKLTFNVLGGQKNSKVSIGGKIPEISLEGKVPGKGLIDLGKKIVKKVSGKCSGYGCPDY